MSHQRTASSRISCRTTITPFHALLLRLRRHMCTQRSLQECISLAELRCQLPLARPHQVESISSAGAGRTNKVLSRKEPWTQPKMCCTASVLHRRARTRDFDGSVHVGCRQTRFRLRKTFPSATRRSGPGTAFQIPVRAGLEMESRPPRF